MRITSPTDIRNVKNKGKSKRPRSLLRFGLALGGLCLTAACASSGSNGKKDVGGASSKEFAFSSEPAVTRIQLLHLSDHESEIIASYPNGGFNSVGGVANTSALVRALTDAITSPTLVLSAGDTFMPAPTLQAGTAGDNPVSKANNLIGLSGAALGNHEFDFGEDFLSAMIKNAAFPYISSTIEVKDGPLKDVLLNVDIDDPAPWLDAIPGKLTPRAKFCASLNRRVLSNQNCPTELLFGVVGSLTQDLQALSSPSSNVVLPLDVKGVQVAIQRQVNALKREGINKVILLSHLQGVKYELELLKEGLTGVDVIIAGGGDDRLADEPSHLIAGDSRGKICGTERRCYPMFRQSLDEEPVVIVATDGQFRYLGRLVVSFDAEGRLTWFDDKRSRPWPITRNSVDFFSPSLDGNPALAQRLEESTVRFLEPMMKSFATTETYFEGRREVIRNQETNLGDLSADAMAWSARKTRPDLDIAFALRNSGGIRDSIGYALRVNRDVSETPIRELDIRSAFRFNNPIEIVETTHQSVVETLEAALREAGYGNGAFPQLSDGVLLQYNSKGVDQVQRRTPSGVYEITQAGSKIVNFSYIDRDGNRVYLKKEGGIVNPTQSITIATLKYLAKGGDAYFPLRHVRPFRTRKMRTKDRPFGPTEQDAFREYLDELTIKGRWAKGNAYKYDGSSSKGRRIQRL